MAPSGVQPDQVHRMVASQVVKDREPSGRVWRTLGAVSLLATLVFASSGCANLRTGDAEIPGIARFKIPAFPQTGANRVQLFTEMHYQPSYRAQEAPRLLPPADSVPFVAMGSPEAVVESDMILKELRYATLEEYKGLTIPARVVQSYDRASAQRLYTINCLVCHGSTLRGDEEEDEAARAKILRFMVRGPFPADLTSPLTQGSTDGELFAFVSNGGRQGLVAVERGRKSASPMPEFRLLLTEDERWSLVVYLRSR